MAFAYHLLVEESGNFDKYCPSYSSYDYFIQVRSEEKNINQKVADALASAYAFELQSSFDMLLPFSVGRIDDEFVDNSTEAGFWRRSAAVFRKINRYGKSKSYRILFIGMSIWRHPVCQRMKK